jgi:hypothetical protein
LAKTLFGKQNIFRPKFREIVRFFFLFWGQNLVFELKMGVGAHGQKTENRRQKTEGRGKRNWV